MRENNVVQKVADAEAALNALLDTANSLKLVSKDKNVNISISAQNGEFNATAVGSDTESQAKILASILANKIKNGEIKQSDVIVTGSAEFKLYVNKYLTEFLQKQNKIEIGQQGEEKNTQTRPPAVKEMESVEPADTKKKIRTIEF